MPLLPFRPLPFPQESAIGYLLRLGAANDFPSLTWLGAYRKHLGLPAQDFSTFFEQTTGHGTTGLQRLWGPSSSLLPIDPVKRLGIKTTFWNLHHRRWCPDCLREDGYWRAEWLLTLQIACPIHRRLLQEHCPVCGQLVGWYSGELALCRCGAALTHGAAAEVVPALQGLARLLSGKFAVACGAVCSPTESDAETGELLVDVHLARLLELLWALGCYTHHRSLKKPLKIQHHHRIAVALPVLDSAARILSNWPTAFHGFMTELSDSSQRQALDLRLFLGLHLKALSKALSHPELHFVRQEFERFVAANWKGVIVDRHRFSDPFLASVQPVITGKEAAEFLDISRKKLQALVNEGRVQGWYQDTKGSRRFLVVDRESVRRFQQGCAGALFTLADAARYLGTSRPRIRLFVAEGLLKPAFRPAGQREQSAHWMFEQVEMDRLLGGLTPPMHLTPDCASMISLNQICRGRARDGADLVTVLRALQSGELNIVARDPCQPGLKGLLLDRQRFDAWFAAHLPEKQLFALAPAARYLGLKEHVLNGLRDRGLLFGFIYPDGPNKPRLKRETLDRFKERYVWGRSLGLLTGFGEKSASRAMLAQGVLPVTGPTVDGGTTYLFLREDVMAHLASKTVSADVCPPPTIWCS